MLTFELLRDKGILVVHPEGPLAAVDFQAVAREVDPWIEAHGRLKGLLVEVATFPGWESFGALVEHLRFVRDHHRNIDRVAAVSDNAFLRIAPRIAEHFAHPEIRVFAAGEKDQALAWLEAGR